MADLEFSSSLGSLSLCRMESLTSSTPESEVPISSFLGAPSSTPMQFFVATAEPSEVDNSSLVNHENKKLVSLGVPFEFWL